MYRTRDEAREEVLSLVRSGLSYREIMKIPFEIEGEGTKRFNLGQISKWKKRADEPEGKVSSAPSNDGVRAAKAYQLFQTGKGPNDVVIAL